VYACIPQSPYVGERWAVEARYQRYLEGRFPDFLVAHSRGNRVLARVFPDWTRTRNGVAMFAHHPQRMLAAWLAGLLDPNPWQQPSDRYDLCFLESDFSRDLLVTSGYPAAKIVVAGKPLLDGSVRRLAKPGAAAALRREVGVEEGQTFVLMNVEPQYEHGMIDRDEHLGRVRTLFRLLGGDGRKVVVSLHPLCDPADYRPVAADEGVSLPERLTIGDLYPVCDVSVSFPCSTNLLAPLFDKPLLIYDFSGLARPESPRADLFRLPGASYAYTVDEVPAALGEVLHTAGGRGRVPESHACAVIRTELESRLRPFTA
jgi:hypothetical protein